MGRKIKGDCISRKETVKRLQALATKRQGSFSGDAYAFAAKVVLGVPAVDGATATQNAMPYAKRLEVYGSAIARNGTLLQAIVALEELSEAQKEICKFLREQGDIDHLAEEVADATIMLEQIRVIFGINDSVNGWIDKKVQRLADRVKGERNDK